MKVTKRYNQHRRDLSIDTECEGCGHKDSDGGAYDDNNFWANVIPNRKCTSCNKSSNDLGTEGQDTHTRYAQHEIV